MVVYSLPHLVVFRQALWLWRKETILTNKPIFLMFFLRYWPLKGHYFPDVCTKAGFQRREQLICDWVAPLTWRGVICNPNELLLFLSLLRACVGSAKASCEYEQLLELFLPRASRTCILCIHQHLMSKPQYNLSPFASGQPMPRLCKKQWGGFGVLSLWDVKKRHFIFYFTVDIGELRKKIPKRLNLQIHDKHFAELIQLLEPRIQISVSK